MITNVEDNDRKGILNPKDEQVKMLYDKYARYPPLLYLDALFGRATENSVYRKKAISSLGLTNESSVLDVACGTGFNFRIIEGYLKNSGKLVGIDISSESLKAAERRIAKHEWTNVELVNMSIMDYEPEIFFDGVLCTFALEIIPDYKAVIDKMFSLLKPQGRFAMIGMKSSRYKLLNPFFEWLYREGRIDVDRDILPYIKSKFNRIDCYEECYFGSYYIVSTSRS